jgi:small subunit ribosomal protein S18
MAMQRPAKKRKPRRPDMGRFRTVSVKPEELDYKNVALLQRLVSAQGKLFGRKRTGLSASMQRALATEIKRSRFMALMPFVS